MLNVDFNLDETAFVAIDVSKQRHDILIERPKMRRKKLKIRNVKEDFLAVSAILSKIDEKVIIGLEATGNYHRAIASFLKGNGFEIRLISSIALSRTREALYNSWDKNDPKDCQVILHMLKQGQTQYFHDPLFEGNQSWQEISKTYYQVSLRKTKLQHSILNHCLPLYFPEAEKYYSSARAEWFASMMLHFPCPRAITKFSKEDFLIEGEKIKGRKVNKITFLKDLYDSAQNSVALPLEPDSVSIEMFKTVLEDYVQICKRRAELEKYAEKKLRSHPDIKILLSVPGIGPIVALTILAEAGDLRRFKHHRQFLKFCGFDLATAQSGQFRGASQLSTRGNSRLRMIFWMAATIACRQPENSFRWKYERYIKNDPTNKHLKRKAYTATAAKMARVVYGLIKSNSEYRPFYENKVAV